MRYETQQPPRKRISIYTQPKTMTKSITREDFYKLFQESERQRQETECRAAETDRRFAELAAEEVRTMNELKKVVYK